MWKSSFPQYHLLKTLLLPPLSGYGTLSKIIWPCKRGFTSGLYSAPLVYASTTLFWLLQLCYMLWNYECESFNFVLFQNCFAYLGSLEIPCEFVGWIFLFMKKKTIRILIGIALNTLVIVDILTILSLPNYEPRISFLSVSFLISFSDVLYF